MARCALASPFATSLRHSTALRCVEDRFLSNAPLISSSARQSRSTSRPFHRLSRQCFSAAMLRILCHSKSAPCFALAHQCFALASQCHSFSLLSARFHGTTYPFLCQASTHNAFPLRYPANPRSATAILSDRFSAIPQQLMPIQFRCQASPLCTTQIYSFAKSVLSVPLRSIPSLITSWQS